jgi:uncharacterized iron-regulated membrane protein
MNLNRTTRKVHYWIGAVILLPVLVVTVSGLLLQVKKQSSWIQPDEHLGTGTVPEVSLAELLVLLQEMPELGVTSWDDVDRLDVRPGKGMTKVRLNSGYEVQVDMGTGEVLQVAYRRTDLIEALHDGSWFGGDWTKLGLFLPSAVGLFVLCVSGVWLFILPFRSRRRKQARGR